MPRDLSKSTPSPPPALPHHNPSSTLTPHLSRSSSSSPSRHTRAGGGRSPSSSGFGDNPLVGEDNPPTPSTSRQTLSQSPSFSSQRHLRHASSSSVDPSPSSSTASASTLPPGTSSAPRGRSRPNLRTRSSSLAGQRSASLSLSPIEKSAVTGEASMTTEGFDLDFDNPDDVEVLDSSAVANSHSPTTNRKGMGILGNTVGVGGTTKNPLVGSSVASTANSPVSARHMGGGGGSGGSSSSYWMNNSTAGNDAPLAVGGSDVTANAAGTAAAASGSGIHVNGSALHSRTQSMPAHARHPRAANPWPESFNLSIRVPVPRNPLARFSRSNKYSQPHHLHTPTSPIPTELQRDTTGASEFGRSRKDSLTANTGNGMDRSIRVPIRIPLPGRRGCRTLPVLFLLGVLLVSGITISLHEEVRAPFAESVSHTFQRSNLKPGSWPKWFPGGHPSGGGKDTGEGDGGEAKNRPPVEEWTMGITPVEGSTQDTLDECLCSSAAVATGAGGLEGGGRPTVVLKGTGTESIFEREADRRTWWVGASDPWGVTNMPFTPSLADTPSLDEIEEVPGSDRGWSFWWLRQKGRKERIERRREERKRRRYMEKRRKLIEKAKEEARREVANRKHKLAEMERVKQARLKEEARAKQMKKLADAKWREDRRKKEAALKQKQAAGGRKETGKEKTTNQGAAGKAGAQAGHRNDHAAMEEQEKDGVGDGTEIAKGNIVAHQAAAPHKPETPGPVGPMQPPSRPPKKAQLVVDDDDDEEEDEEEGDEDEDKLRLRKRAQVIGEPMPDGKQQGLEKMGDRPIKAETGSSSTNATDLDLFDDDLHLDDDRFDEEDFLHRMGLDSEEAFDQFEQELARQRGWYIQEDKTLEKKLLKDEDELSKYTGINPGSHHRNDSIFLHYSARDPFLRRFSSQGPTPSNYTEGNTTLVLEQRELVDEGELSKRAPSFVNLTTLQYPNLKSKNYAGTLAPVIDQPPQCPICPSYLVPSSPSPAYHPRDKADPIPQLLMGMATTPTRLQRQLESTWRHWLAMDYPPGARTKSKDPNVKGKELKSALPLTEATPHILVLAPPPDRADWFMDEGMEVKIDFDSPRNVRVRSREAERYEIRYFSLLQELWRDAERNHPRPSAYSTTLRRRKQARLRAELAQELQDYRPGHNTSVVADAQIPNATGETGKPGGQKRDLSHLSKRDRQEMLDAILRKEEELDEEDKEVVGGKSKKPTGGGSTMASAAAKADRLMNLDREIPEAEVGVDWFVIGDDDTFFPDLDMVYRLLGEYDPDDLVMIGGLSESQDAITHFGHMAYGGAGMVLSRGLMQKINSDGFWEECERRFAHVFGGDEMVTNCAALALDKPRDEAVTFEPSFHQFDIHGDGSGIFQAGMMFTTWHHWASWMGLFPAWVDSSKSHLSLLRLASAAKGLGGNNWGRRYVFDWDWEEEKANWVVWNGKKQKVSGGGKTGRRKARVVVSLGYSVTIHEGEGISEDELANAEKTWWEVTQTLFPTRPALREGLQKREYFLSGVKVLKRDNQTGGSLVVLTHTNKDGESIDIIWDGRESELWNEDQKRMMKLGRS